MGHLVPTEHRRANECVGLLLLTLAILSGLSLISFNPDDPSLNISKNPLFDARPANFIGLPAPTLPICFSNCGAIPRSSFPSS